MKIVGDHIENDDGTYIAKIRKNVVTKLYNVVWYDSDYTTLDTVITFLKKV